MEQVIDWVQYDEISDCGDPIYSLDRLTKNFWVKKLNPDCWMVKHEVNSTLYYAVMEFVFSEVDNKNIHVTPVFHGQGVPGLRECRHMWVGDKDGYIYYPNARNITDGLKELSNYFDMN